jgi:hypothetical protein
VLAPSGHELPTATIPVILRVLPYLQILQLELVGIGESPAHVVHCVVRLNFLILHPGVHGMWALALLARLLLPPVPAPGSMTPVCARNVPFAFF